MNKIIEMPIRKIAWTPLLYIQSQGISMEWREWYEKLRSVGTLLAEHKASPTWLQR